ncbi:MAG: PLP-dependent aminotransferase family protein [Dehalococcoidia bacterium]|nr:PLP-dependent aminotransferase family protein [Dehalococcoidia bacterium]
MDLDIDRRSPVPLYRQIAEALRARILDGSIPIGSRLPSERSLARALDVNRSTVVNAYDELAADGLVIGRVGRGTAVACCPEEDEPLSRPVVWQQLFAEEGQHLVPWRQEIRSGEGRPDGAGLVSAELDPELVPLAEVGRLLRELLDAQGSGALAYLPTEGLPPLREAIAERLRQRGARYHPENVVITAGAQQALDLVARAFLGSDDEAAIESPTYPGAIHAFRQRRPRLVAIPSDDQGMRIDALQQAFARRCPILVFTIPNFNNPTGTSMSPERRGQLLQFSRRNQIPVVEDDAFSEIYFGGERPLPLASLTPADHVIHIGTFSKMLVPGLRVGWLAAPKPVVERVLLFKQIADLHTATLSQWLALRALETGLVDAFLDRARPVFARRRDALISELTRELQGVVHLAPPQGGLCVWCRLTEGLPARRVLGVAAERGVAFLPGDVFSVEGGHHSYLRLAFGRLREEDARGSVAVLKQAIDQVRAESKREQGREARKVVPFV